MIFIPYDARECCWLCVIYPRARFVEGRTYDLSYYLARSNSSRYFNDPGCPPRIAALRIGMKKKKVYHKAQIIAYPLPA